MRRLTVKQIDNKIAYHEAEITRLKAEREISELYDQIAEKRKAMKPARKRVSRKLKTAPTKVEKPPNEAASGQTPDDATDLPPKATGKPRKPRRTKAQIEAEKKAAGNPEPLYRCLNPYCPRKGKPFPDSEAKWEIKPSTGMTHVQCPDCESFDVVLNED